MLLNLVFQLILLTEIFFPFLGISNDPVSVFSEPSVTNKIRQEVAAREFCAGWWNGVAKLTAYLCRTHGFRTQHDSGVQTGRSDFECDSGTLDCLPCLYLKLGSLQNPKPFLMRKDKSLVRRKNTMENPTGNF